MYALHLETLLPQSILQYGNQYIHNLQGYLFINRDTFSVIRAPRDIPLAFFYMQSPAGFCQPLRNNLCCCHPLCAQLVATAFLCVGSHNLFSHLWIALCEYAQWLALQFIFSSVSEYDQIPGAWLYMFMWKESDFAVAEWLVLKSC